jgi:prepilin-type N-terminal cleavage/methylation domain-containing protein
MLMKTCEKSCLRAFTLVELLVVISIIGVVTTLGFSATAVLRKSGNQTRELAAGRQLIAAYIRAASENNGALLPAYEPGAVAQNEAGETIAGPSAERYPWRLAPFLDHRVFGTLLVNEQEKIGRDASAELLDYMVSFGPNFGMNGTYVGGNYRSSLAPGGLAEKRFGRFCVQHINEVVSPSQLIVFCTSHYPGVSGKPYLGHHLVSAPYESERTWKLSAHDKGASAENRGFIDLRYDGRALVVMFDGHTELLSLAQLEDMRRWSNQAAERDAHTFKLQRQ